MNSKTVVNMMLGGGQMTEKLNSFFKTYGLSVQQYHILRVLQVQAFKPLNLYMLQEYMIHKSSNITRLVEKLRKKELIERKPCENNRRKVEVVITHKGLGLLDGIEEALIAYEKKLIANLNHAEQAQLNSLLEKLNQ